MAMVAAQIFFNWKPEASKTPAKVRDLFLVGAGIGSVSSLAAVGGGFLSVTYLSYKNLDMKKAIGTSLLVIGVQSMIGFLAGLPDANPEWHLLLKITALSVMGFFAGNYLSEKISAGMLRNTFGWFVLCIGIYIILKELTF